MRPSTSLDPLLALLCAELAALHELGDLPGGDVARLLQPGLHERVVDVLEHDGNAGGGDRLGNLPAHRAGAYYRGLENEHVMSSWLLRSRQKNRIGEARGGLWIVQVGGTLPPAEIGEGSAGGAICVEQFRTAHVRYGEQSHATARSDGACAVGETVHARFRGGATCGPSDHAACGMVTDRRMRGRRSRTCTGSNYAGTAVGSSALRGSSVSRAITSRWICEVPSYSCMIFASRNSFSTGYSLMKP